MPGAVDVVDAVDQRLYDLTRHFLLTTRGNWDFERAGCRKGSPDQVPCVGAFQSGKLRSPTVVLFGVTLREQGPEVVRVPATATLGRSGGAVSSRQHHLG